MAKADHAGKSAPFPIEEWPSVVIQGLSILNRNNWFPVLTLMIGNPGETDADSMATLDLIYEVERRGLSRLLRPFHLHTAARHPAGDPERGHRKPRKMTRAAWQILLKCWKMSIKAALQSWWGPPAWRSGAFLATGCRSCARPMDRLLPGRYSKWITLRFSTCAVKREGHGKHVPRALVLDRLSSWSA